MAGSFEKKLKAFRVASIQDADKTKRAVAFSLFSSIVKDTPVDTGRARGNWQATLGAPAASSSLRRDKRKGPPGPEVSQEILANLPGLGKKGFLTNNLPYSMMLEMGSSQQAPAGMVRKNMARIQGILRKALKGL